MSLRAISKTMKATSPVFIIGAPRSGTSILYRTLQKHSSFKSREENLQETKLLNYANCSHVFKGNEPKALFHYMLNDQRYYQQFLDSIRPIQ
ncbi:MAG: sulfotransferase, partial [Pseudomonadota bacterium]